MLYFSIVLNRMVNLEQIEQEVVRYATKLVQGVLRVEIDCYGSVQINSRSIRENPDPLAHSPQSSNSG